MRVKIRLDFADFVLKEFRKETSMKVERCFGSWVPLVLAEVLLVMWYNSSVDLASVISAV